MGIGQRETAEAFVKACEVFVYTENLTPPEEIDAPSPDVIAGDWTEKARRAIEITTQDDGWAFLGAVGAALRKLDSAFDVRSYGHKQLSLLITSRPDLFEVRPEKTPEGPTLVYVKLKS